MSDLLDALELIGESADVKHATVCIRLATDAAVDQLYAAIGPTVDASGKRIAKESVPPEWDQTEDGAARWRTATVTVAGVRVILNGPMDVTRGRRAA
jgi:hypothetical protein